MLDTDITKTKVGSPQLTVWS